MGVSALSLEDDPSGRGDHLLLWSFTTAALLAAWVGSEGHMHTHLTEGRSHFAAQDNGKETKTTLWGWIQKFYR